VLALGFNDLALRSIPPPPTPAPTPTPAPIVPPPPAPEPVVSRGPYTKEAADVVQPVALKQDLPPYPGRVATARSGVLDVLIDATGAVESAELIGPFDPAYTRIVLAAVKKWAFQPARLGGAPVRFRKQIQIVVSPGP
jgi:hypothetical protein